MSSELEDLEHALDVANKVTFAGLSSGVKTDALARVSRLRNKLDALDATVFTAFEATQEHRAEGHSSPIGWLEHHQRVKGPDAARRRRLARRLRGMSLAAEALRDGQITAEHVETLARARHLVGDDAFEIAEEALVDIAIERRFSDFARYVEYFVIRVQPRDAEARAARQIEDAYGSSSRLLDGSGKVDAQLEPVAFSVWQAELERCMAHLLEADRREAHDRLGRRPVASELRRTTRQRRAAAMALMAERSAAFDGELGPSSMSLVVHGNVALVAAVVAVLRQALAAQQGDTTAEDFDLDGALDGIELGPDSLHELADGTPITLNTIILALLTGTVRGILFDPAGEILRFGHERRLFTRPQAQALQAKYRRCCHPYGCDRTAPWVQADHIREHHDGGATDAGNGQILEDNHNIWKTNHKDQPPPPTGTPPDQAQRRLPPDIGPPPSELR